VRAILRENRARRDAIAHHYVEVAARADKEHRLRMQGDERGFYGQYPVAPL